MKDYTQVERDNAALTIREYAFGQMNMLRMLGDEDAANNLQEAINIAIAALREKQRMLDGTMPSCEICVAGEQAYSRGGDTAEINGNTLTVCAGAYFETISEFEINICPWCGRHLASDQAKDGG